MQGSHSNN